MREGVTQVHKYVATFRAIYEADDDAKAALVAEKIRENGTQDLDDEDTLDVTQVTSNHLELEPVEVQQQLARARNLLIKTRMREGVDLARGLDRFIFALKFRDSPSYTQGGYDHGRFMDVLLAILERGEEPDVSTGT